MDKPHEQLTNEHISQLRKDIKEAGVFLDKLRQAKLLVGGKYREACTDWRRNLVEDVVVLTIADTTHMIADWKSQLAKLENKAQCDKCGALVPSEQITLCEGVGHCFTCYQEHIGF